MDESDAEGRRYRSLRYLRAVRDYLYEVARAESAGHPTGPVLRRACVALGVSQPTFYRLLARYKKDSSADSLLGAQRGVRRGARQLPAEVEAIIDDEIANNYLRLERPRKSDVVLAIRARVHAAGHRPPDRKTIRRRIADVPRAKAIAKRHGEKAAKYAAEPLSGAVQVKEPLELVQIDHTMVDAFALDEFDREVLGRPWLTLAIDVYSRMVLGYYLTMDHPSSLSVAMCLSMAVLEKEPWLARLGLTQEWPACGVPKVFGVDNAKEFRSRAFMSACERHGIEIDYRPPGVPHFGGHIERLIGTMMGAVHLLPGTTFSSVAQKGDYNPEKHACLTLRDMERWLVLEIVGKYHQLQHSQTLMPPIEMWRRSPPLRQNIPSDPHSFFVDFLPCEQRVIRPEGIRINNIYYKSDGLAHLIGRGRLPVRYNPASLKEVYVSDGLGGYIRTPYKRLGRPDISLWEHRRAHEILAKLGRRCVDETTVFETILQQRKLVEQAQKVTRAVRRERDRRQRQHVDVQERTFDLTGGDDRAPDPEEHDVTALDLPTYPVEEWDDA